MIKREISKSDIEKAKSLYEFDELNNSITKGKGNIIGAIGEVMTYNYFIEKGHDVDFNSTYDYDLIVDGFRVDVKSKATNYPPKDYFNATVASFNTSQNCDYYLFAYVTYDHKTCYLAGYKDKEEFYSVAKFGVAGEIDRGTFRYRADCYNLQLKHLNGFK